MRNNNTNFWDFASEHPEVILFLGASFLIATVVSILIMYGKI